MFGSRTVPLVALWSALAGGLLAVRRLLAQPALARAPEPSRSGRRPCASETSVTDYVAPAVGEVQVERRLPAKPSRGKSRPSLWRATRGPLRARWLARRRCCRLCSSAPNAR